ncbi:hypothetical protein [Arsenicibacter rosenii]|uniref:Outer membrane lipoprotein-sorting protein n=1 Tax=Arsenicibacter rosenii TaxID=1750698 RepID=A0A1S2VCQ0_9BACT|nr:hypothetical protein [Arsenicibacter rosenii]OIN56537.1 hypothetical protein BLX24_24005 [Arsenicibacter rosenii]
MKKVMLLGAFFLSALAIQAQSVDEIVNKHVEAMGGADKYKNLKAIRMQTSTELMGQSLPTTSVIALGKGMRSDVTVMGATISQGYDGQQGWMINPMQGSTAAEATPAELNASMDVQLDITGPFYNYKEKGNTIELLGKEKLDGADVYKVKITRKNGLTETQYLDAATYMNRKTVSVLEVGGQKNENETMFSDYRAVEGLKFPFVTQMTHPQFGTMKMKVDKLEVNPVIDETKFKMPK